MRIVYRRRVKLFRQLYKLFFVISICSCVSFANYSLVFHGNSDPPPPPCLGRSCNGQQLQQQQSDQDINGNQSKQLSGLRPLPHHQDGDDEGKFRHVSVLKLVSAVAHRIIDRSKAVIHNFDATKEAPVIAVLLIACNRVTVSRSLEQILKYRPSAEKFPVIVSQDCGDKATTKVLQSYGDKITLIQHPDLSDIKVDPKAKRFKGYYKIARHYAWALNQTFMRMRHETVLIVEDDLDLSPDFFEYFSATYPVLTYDPTIWCISAWNDNGKDGLVSSDPELLWRTDFFPGLGWMLKRSVWMELMNKWPITFWDDWMRKPEQRKGRSCIRPEVSRTKTFGKIGVSKGQFYDKVLKFIKLNDHFVPFTKKNLTYLFKDYFDQLFTTKVFSSPVVTLKQVMDGSVRQHPSIRVQYNSKDEWKKIAKTLGAMDDYKAGVPRQAYRGVVSIMYRTQRVYIAPPVTWKAYDTTWK